MTTTGILLAILAATVEFDAVGIDGSTVRGELREFTAEKCVLATTSGERTLPTAQLVRIAQSGTSPVDRTAGGAWVRFADGSRLVGRSYETKNGQATIGIDGGAQVVAPIHTVRWVRFKGLSPEMTAQWEQIAESPVKADAVVIREENALDYLEGVLGDVGSEALDFQLNGEKVVVKRSKPEGLVYFHNRASGADASFCTLTDAAGSKLNVAVASLSAGVLNVRTSDEVAIPLPVERISSIEFPAQYLTALKPESVEYTPRVPSSSAVAATVAAYYRPRFDRSLTSGPLRLDGREYFRGLAMRSRTEISFLLPDAFTRFTAVAGIDDRGRPAGNVRLVIRGDDRVLLDRIIKGTDEPLPVALDVSGVARLKILVDYGDDDASAGGTATLGDDVGDHFDLCDPRLFK